MMWLSEVESDDEDQWNQDENFLFRELMAECAHATPGARFPDRLRAALEDMPPEYRQAFVNRTRRGNAPLFVAAQRGSTENTQYLVQVCGADVEQRGIYRLQDAAGRAPPTHRVTPLWCAAVAGRTRALRTLCDAGADIDARSDTGSTPARSACYLARAETLRELANRGADLRAPNHAGGTCLMNAVHSPALVAFLLSRGVPVDDRDAAGNTALHHAVRERREDVARLLLEGGADPCIKDHRGDDALRLAALSGCVGSVAILSRRGKPSRLKRAEALAILGATLALEGDFANEAEQCWWRALRLSGGTVPAGGEIELARALRDPKGPREVALQVNERTLGRAHPENTARLLSVGVSLYRERKYRAALDAWVSTYRACCETDCALHADAEEAARACARLVCGDIVREDGRAFPAFEDAHLAFSAIAEHLPAAAALLAVRPACRNQKARLWSVIHCAGVSLHAASRLGGGGGRLATTLRSLTPGVLAGLLRVCAEGGRWAHTPPSRHFGPTRRLAPSRRAVGELLRAGASAGPRVGRTSAMLGAPASVVSLLTTCCPPARCAPPPLACMCARVLRNRTAPRALADAAKILPTHVRDFLMYH